MSEPPGPEPPRPDENGSPGAAPPTPPRPPSTHDHERLTAYRYLVEPARADYLAIMRVFTATLLADMSAPEVTEKLTHDGVHLPAETVALRLDQLKQWGALLTSSRPVKAASVAEYQRSRGRYQLSPLGEIVQRHSEELLAADAIREVSHELLVLVARGLDELATRAEAAGGIAPTDALERISTIFAQFERFVESVRDFYAYLGQVINRLDLDNTEFHAFKDLLLDYAETITEDVARQTPVIRAALERLWPHLPALLDRVNGTDTGLSGALAGSEIQVRRSSGRELDDWQELRRWFLDMDGQGGEVAQLRMATMKALQSLLGNAKRMLRSSAMGELSRRNDLLKLAKWLDESDDAQAHDLVVAALGMYGMRHLGGGPAEEGTATAATSWWHGPRADVAVSLREHGKRAVRGTYRREGEDYSGRQEEVQAAAEEEERRRHEAALELRAAEGMLDQVRLSAIAFDLFVVFLSNAMSQPEDTPNGPVYTCADVDLRLAVFLTRKEGWTTMIHSEKGNLILPDHHVEIRSYDIRAEGSGS